MSAPKSWISPSRFFGYRAGRVDTERVDSTSWSDPADAMAAQLHHLVIIRVREVTGNWGSGSDPVVTRDDIGRALNLGENSIGQLFAGERALKVDEFFLLRAYLLEKTGRRIDDLLTPEYMTFPPRPLP